jgi:predicted S18 family serine protease
MRHKSKLLLLGLTVLLAAAISGCDTSADRELRRAEESINAAQALGADASATEDFQSAEQLLMKAQDLARRDKITEARATAIEAKIRADDALRKAQEQQKILDDEADRLGK